MNDVNVYPSRQSGEGVQKNTFRTYFLRSEEWVTNFYFAKILNFSIGQTLLEEASTLFLQSGLLHSLVYLVDIEVIHIDLPPLLLHAATNQN